MNSRLEVIEQAVLDSPARALELPLLRRDMENLQQRYQADLQSTREDVKRISDWYKWFFGLMFTMVVGLISLNVANFLTRAGKKDKNKTTKEVSPSQE